MSNQRDYREPADQGNQSNFAPDPNRGDYNANAGPEGASISDVDSDYTRNANEYDQGTAGGTDRTYASDAVTNESGYGAGETGSVNRGSERTGVTTGAGYDSSATTDNAARIGGAEQNNVPDPHQAGRAGQAMANSKMGARFSEANANAGQLTDSDQGYATGVAGGSGADEARGYHTSSDPEYGERDMGYGNSLDNPDSASSHSR